MITVRAARFPDDLEQLQTLSPPAVKPVIEFFIYPTLVAVEDEQILGYSQFTLGLDKVLHSTAIRVGVKGKGIGTILLTEKRRLAIAAGAIAHYYCVARDGEVALKKILLKLGMHLCRDGEVQLYAEHFGDRA